MSDIDEVMKEQEAAAMLKFSPRKLFDLRKSGLVPHKIIGGQVRYLRSSLIEWMQGGDQVKASKGGIWQT